MAKFKQTCVFSLVILITLVIVFVYTKHADQEFLCAENGQNMSTDTEAAIIGKWGYYSKGNSLVRWDIETGVIDHIEEGAFYQLHAYKDELHYYDGNAIISLDPITGHSKTRFQIPDGETVFSYFLYHDTIFCILLDYMVEVDPHSGNIISTWDNMTASNTTYAVMDDKLYFLVSDIHHGSNLFKYDKTHHSMELLESGYISNLFNTSEALIYQRYQENWANGTWKVYQHGKETPLEIDLGLIIGTTPEGIVSASDNFKEFYFWDGKEQTPLAVPSENFKDPRMTAYICTGEYLVIIGFDAVNTDYVFSIALR